MIERDLPDCPHCQGTGRAVNVARGVAIGWPCSCPAGRTLALPMVPVLRVAVRTRSRSA